MKISSKNDYSEGCYPSILKALLRTNFESDTHTAIRLITSWATTDEMVASFIENI